MLSSAFGKASVGAITRAVPVRVLCCWGSCATIFAQQFVWAWLLEGSIHFDGCGVTLVGMVWLATACCCCRRTPTGIHGSVRIVSATGAGGVAGVQTFSRQTWWTHLSDATAFVCAPWRIWKCLKTCSFKSTEKAVQFELCLANVSAYGGLNSRIRSSTNIRWPTSSIPAYYKLTANPEYAQPVLQFLETLRAPAPEAPLQDQLPVSCNKFRLLSQAQLRDLLCKVSPTHADRIARVKGKHLALLLCFVINQDIASALYSKNKAVPEARVLQAAVRAGNRLNRVNWDSPDGVSWPMSGYFLIVLDDDQKPTHLQHVSGAQVPWPEAFAGVQDVPWSIEENYAFGKARVVGGMISVACTTIFSEAGAALQPPTFMPGVPEQTGA